MEGIISSQPYGGTDANPASRRSTSSPSGWTNHSWPTASVSDTIRAPRVGNTSMSPAGEVNRSAGWPRQDSGEAGTDPAVDDPVRAGHEGSGIGGQERDHFGHLGWLGDSAERVHLVHLFTGGRRLPF